MIRNATIITIVLFVCIIAGCHSMEPKENNTIQTKEVKGLTLTYLLDSLHINPIAVSDTDKRYIKEYKKIPDDFRINFDFPKLQDGSWMLIGRAYGKPRYVVQVKNGKKHGLNIIIDEKTGIVRSIDQFIEGKRNGLSVTYDMSGFKDGISFFSNDNMIDTQYLLHQNGSIKKKLYHSNGIYRIIEFNDQNDLMEDKFQYKDSNVTFNYINRKLVSKIKYHHSQIIVVHFDSNEVVFRIDSNRATHSSGAFRRSFQNKFQYRDSDVTFNYINEKLVSKIKNDYSRPGETIVVHFDYYEKVFKIDTNRIK